MPTDVTISQEAGRWDRWGVWLSSLCAVHCLVVPVLTASLPMLPFAFDLHVSAHVLLAFFIVPITAFAVWGVRRNDRFHMVRILLLFGVALILTALLGHDWLGAMGETVVTLVGSGLLIFGHLLSWSRRRQCAV